MTLTEFCIYRDNTDIAPGVALHSRNPKKEMKRCDLLQKQCDSKTH